MCIFEAITDHKLKYSTFDSELWVQNELQKNQENPSRADDDHSLLVGFFQHSDEDIHVLDFGGSLGFGFIALCNAYPDREVGYTVVETPALCTAGDDYHTSHHISFTSTIPLKSHFTAIYLRTALQYVRDWKETLAQLISLNPETIILSHLSAGNVPSFQAIQNYYGNKIPYWWISMHELQGVLAEAGYVCTHNEICQKLDESTYCDSIEPNLRIDSTRDVVFRRGDI